MAAKILICDNEEALRTLVCAALDGAGYELAEARDGDESVELARALRPDVLVLDLMMPGRTGLEVVRELRQSEDFEKTRFVMLTARAQAADREAAIAAGADAFLTKPFSPLELARVVGELVASPELSPAGSTEARGARARPAARAD
jgi:CheY-like chemotaxis protein